MKHLTKTQAYVLEIIKRNPGCQNEEMKLLEAVYLDQGWDDTKSLYWNLTRVTHPESIARARRKLHEYGLITYSKDADNKRYTAFKSEQERHGSHYEHMAEIVKPKIRVEVINGEYVTVME